MAVDATSIPVIYEGTPEERPYRWHGSNEPACNAPHVWVSRFHSQHATYGGGALGPQEYSVLVIGYVDLAWAYREVVYGTDRYDPACRNTIGGLGAFVHQPPTADHLAPYILAAQRAIAAKLA